VSIFVYCQEKLMPAESATEISTLDIATPVGSGGFVAHLISEQPLPAAAARLGAWIAAKYGKPVRLGSKVVVARHGHVMEVLSRDLDFLIAPVNQQRIEEVNGPFILGMDRDVVLAVERRAIYQGLARLDLGSIGRDVEKEAAERVSAAGETFEVVGDYARPIAAHTARSLFGVGGSDERTFMDVARAIFAHTFLNLGGDKAVERRAVNAAALMRNWLSAEIARRRASHDPGSDLMGALMREDVLDDDGIRRNLGGMLVGSIDTTASSVAKIVAMIGRDPRLAKRIAADVEDQGRLAGWCWEALRRWPHNPVVLRKAARGTRLADVEIRKGDDIIAWTQAAMLDTAAFPDPQQMRHDRPAKAYLHFGGGLHPCAGRAVNAFQIPLLVRALVRRGIRSVGPVEWAGPFPDRLSLQFER
jgi:cytochrome P450